MMFINTCSLLSFFYNLTNNILFLGNHKTSNCKSTSNIVIRLHYIIESFNLNTLGTSLPETLESMQIWNASEDLNDNILVHKKVYSV